MNDQQTEHEHKDQGESEEKMSDEIKEKFLKVKAFYKVVNEERKNFMEKYSSLMWKEISINNTDEFYRQYDELKKEIGEGRQTNFSKKLFEQIPKQGKSS